MTEDSNQLVGENRCWTCTITNGLLGLIVAGVPLLGGLQHEDPRFLALTVVWAVGVLSFTLFRLVSKGYLPGSKAVARRTGLHDRIGPGSTDRRADRKREDDERGE
jgi:hypothetical protein